VNAAQRQTLINKIAALPGQIEELVAGLTPEQLTAHPLAGEWSVAQNVHHLADSHINSYVRCRLVLTEDHPTLKPYNQEDWAEIPDAASADVSTSLAILRGLHGRWVHFWEGLADADFARTAFHPESGEVTLQSLLETYAAHGEAHIDQITRTLAAQR